MRKTLKIKPKLFFKNTRTAPLLNKKVHWYLLFKSLIPTEVKPSEDLKTYTKQNVRTRKFSKSNYRSINPHSAQEFADFGLLVEHAPETHKVTDTDIFVGCLASFHIYPPGIACPLSDSDEEGPDLGEKELAGNRVGQIEEEKQSS